MAIKRYEGRWCWWELRCDVPLRFRILYNRLQNPCDMNLSFWSRDLRCFWHTISPSTTSIGPNVVLSTAVELLHPGLSYGHCLEAVQPVFEIEFSWKSRKVAKKCTFTRRKAAPHVAKILPSMVLRGQGLDLLQGGLGRPLA